MNIAMITPEAVPFAKTGSLGEVTTNLCLELEKLGHSVIMVLPYYKVIKNTNIPTTRLSPIITLNIGNKVFEAKVHYAKIGKWILVYLLENGEFFDRDGLYGTYTTDYADNGYRFGFFCKAVLELLVEIGFKPDILHVNDWQTAMVPFFLKTIEKENPFFKDTRTVLTIHNICYQGLFNPSLIPELGLPWDVYNPFTGIEFYGNINFLKAGIISTDIINTLSKRYAQEIQTQEFGCGLSGVLQRRSQDIVGILHGVDYTNWDPNSDKFIAQNYSIEDLRGKDICRKDLLNEFGLTAKKGAPIIGIISRLHDDKGIDLIVNSIHEMVKMNIRLIILGIGDEKYHKLLTELMDIYPESLAVKIAISTELAHKIVAGSDIFLMPSRIEPFAKYHLYALRYGTVPIVRSTGSLDDAIYGSNGFKFQEYSSNALLNAVKQAIETYKDKNLWQGLIKKIMKQDFSWTRCAREFVKMYKM